MPQANVPNLGEAISLQARHRDPGYLQELHRIQQDEGRALAAAQKALGQRKALVDKYRNELGKFTIKEESGILPVYHQPLQAKMNEVFDYFNKRKSEDDNYNPYADTNMDKLKQEFHQMADAFKISSENFTKQIANYSVNQDKYEINEDLLNAANSKDYNSFVNAISLKDPSGNVVSKTDFYSMGLLIPKKKTTSWTLGADKFADQMKNLYVKNPDGSQYINKAAFEEQWSAAKTDPGNLWYQDADAVNKALNYNNEESDEIIKSYVLNQLPYQPAPEKGKGFTLNIGGGGGAIGDMKFDIVTEKEPIEKVVSTTGGKAKTGEKEVETVIFQQEGATQLPLNTFIYNKVEVVGRPLGKLKNVGTSESPDLQMEMLVPKGGESMMALIETSPPETNPDKYKKVLVPINTSPQNNAKWKIEYGGGTTNVEEVYKQLKGAKPKTTEAKTTYTNITTIKSAGGKTIKAGVKDGKWYDTETGKPL